MTNIIVRNKIKNINDDLEKGKNYYNDNGYVVFSSVVAQKTCIELRSHCEEKVKPHKNTIYRQATAKAEKNLFNDKKSIIN